MADYLCVCRSNYFRVKEQDKFIEWCNRLNLGFYPNAGDMDCWMVYHDSGSWPSCIYDEGAGEEVEIDLLQELSEHLVSDSVAVLMESGHCKLRHLSGHAQAVNASGRVVEVSLDEIYERATGQLGGEVTRAEH